MTARCSPPRWNSLWPLRKVALFLQFLFADCFSFIGFYFSSPSYSDLLTFASSVTALVGLFVTRFAYYLLVGWPHFMKHSNHWLELISVLALYRFFTSVAFTNCDFLVLSFHYRTMWSSCVSFVKTQLYQQAVYLNFVTFLIRASKWNRDKKRKRERERACKTSTSV